MAFKKYNMSFTLEANRKLEVFIIACVVICVSTGVLGYMFWRHDKPPNPSKWCHPGAPQFAVNISKEELTSDGDTYTTKAGDRYGPGTYWRYSDGTFAGCVCSIKTCLRKCCPHDKFLWKGDQCTTQSQDMSAVFSAFIRDFGFVDSVKDLTRRTVKYGMIYGKNKKLGLIRELKKGEDYVMSDGRIVSISYEDLVTYYDQSQYCWDVYKSKVNVIFLDENENDTEFWKYCMLFSVPFLVVTIVVYALLPSLRNLHGKALMCHLACLTVSYMTRPLNPTPDDWDNSKAPCYALGFISQFSSLAAFFWLNVMCFDVWWMLSGHSSCNNSKGIAAERRRDARFLLYSLYAWGVPLLIATLTLSMEIPGIPLNYIKPHFGVSCGWFRDNESVWLYFYLPVLVLLCANALMFAFTGRRLQNFASSSRAINREDAFRLTPDWARYKMLVKLFFSMGLIWIVDVMAEVLMYPMLTVVAHLASGLQGLVIAYIFLYKRRVLQMLRQKYRPECVQPPSNTSNRTDNQLITVAITEETNVKSVSISSINVDAID